MKSTRAFILTLITVFVSGCAVQHNIKPRVVASASHFDNVQLTSGVMAATSPYRFSGKGIDYREAGLHPILITITNKSTHDIAVDPEQIIGDGIDGEQYIGYQPQEAIELIIGSSAMEEAAKGAASGAAIGAGIGALVGLALGAVLNVDKPGEIAAFGAVVGGLNGSAGGARGNLEQLKKVVHADVTNNCLNDVIVAPGMTFSGWIYFPEASGYSGVVITVFMTDTGTPLVFRFPIS